MISDTKVEKIVEIINIMKRDFPLLLINVDIAFKFANVVEYYKESLNNDENLFLCYCWIIFSKKYIPQNELNNYWTRITQVIENDTQQGFAQQGETARKIR